jgi:hypothetical protein
MPEKNWPSWSRGAEKGRTSLRIMALDAIIDELPPDADVEANRLMCMALLAAVALIVALVDLAGHRARCFAGARGAPSLPRTPNNSAGHSTEGSRDRAL